jgi:hypothetical protein
MDSFILETLSFSLEKFSFQFLASWNRSDLLVLLLQYSFFCSHYNEVLEGNLLFILKVQFYFYIFFLFSDETFHW